MNYSVMPLICNISKDNEAFLISSVGDNPHFWKQVAVLRDVFHGRFEHNAETADGRRIKNIWVFDTHLALPVCKAMKEIDDTFAIPEWVSAVDHSKDTEFKKFRGAIDPALIKSDWKGEYQRKGVLRGLSQNRLAWFYEMGLGKTFVMQNVMNHLVQWGRVNKYIIVSPPEGIINIAMECVKFNSFGLTWDDIYIVDTAHRNPYDYPEKKVFIMTYRNVIMLHDDAYKAARNKVASKNVRKNYIPWDRLGDKLCLILDESHNIKNPASKTWKIIDKARCFFEYRYLLSGTPAPKYAADLWTQMRFLHEDSVAKDYDTFLRGIAVLGTKYSQYAVSFYKEDRVKDFLNSVEYLIDRQKAKGNIALPPVIFEPIRCQMPPKHKRLYQAIADQVLTIIKREENGRVTLHKLQNKFPYLSSVLHDPCVLHGGSLAENPYLSSAFNDSNVSAENPNISFMRLLEDWSIEDNGKFSIAASLIDQYAEENRKIILWSGHPKIIDVLYEKFLKYKPYRLHGRTVVHKGESPAERNAAVCDRFLSDSHSRLLIANYDCLSTAVNLIEVTRMIFWDRSWDASTYIQALKRANRIGSTEPLIVNNLIIFRSLEEFQNEEIDKRLSFNDNLWEGRKNAEDTLDTRDILSLSDVKRILAGTSVK
jgi:SNF2 family DNA or RNA helicase